MLLRYLVSNWARQTAHQKIREAVSGISDSTEAEAHPAEPPPPAEVVCLFALSAEAGGLVDLLADCVTSRCPSFVEHAGYLEGRRAAVVETGVGQAAAARATADVIALHRPAWIVSAGFAGALRDDLRRGHFLMADEVVDTGGARLSIGIKFDQRTIASTPSLHGGRLLTVDNLIRTTDAKRQLAAKHDAVACDMETLAIADVCRQEKVRFLSVRIISDAVEDELPKEIEKLLDQKSLASKLGAAAGAVFNRPSSVKDMWKLKEQAIRASDRLARFLTSAVSQLDS